MSLTLFAAIAHLISLLIRLIGLPLIPVSYFLLVCSTTGRFDTLLEVSCQPRELPQQTFKPNSESTFNPMQNIMVVAVLITSAALAHGRSRDRLQNSLLNPDLFSTEWWSESETSPLHWFAISCCFVGWLLSSMFHSKLSFLSLRAKAETLDHMQSQMFMGLWLTILPGQTITTLILIFSV